MTVLEELAQERAAIMERLQAIDDEASALLEEERQAHEMTLKTWQHLLPRPELEAAARDIRPPSPFFTPGGPVPS